MSIQEEYANGVEHVGICIVLANMIETGRELAKSNVLMTCRDGGVFFSLFGVEL